MDFEVTGEIQEIQTIARKRSIREAERLDQIYGRGDWRKLKGIVFVRLKDGTVCKAEVHWYEAHGIGKKELKIKRYLI